MVRVLRALPFVIALGAASAGSAQVPAAAGSPGGAGPSVTVVNGAANPVPVVQQGPVAVTAGQPLPVVQQGPVVVTPSATSARQPVSFRFDKHSAGGTVDYTVPAGKILVLESVAVWMEIRSELAADDLDLRIREAGLDYVNGPGVQFVPLRVAANGHHSTYSLASGELTTNNATGVLTARFYAGPGSDLIFSIPQVRFGENFAAAVITISGYLVPADSPSLGQ